MQLHAQRQKIEQVVVTADQMNAIESRIFAAGMPVAALMEKVASRMTERICDLYPIDPHPLQHPLKKQTVYRVGILVGPGHNGGDALVIARELVFRGYTVVCYQPLAKLKPLTASHAKYAASLGIDIQPPTSGFTEAELAKSDLIIDGLFGFGLNRELTGAIAHLVETVNTVAHTHQIPIISIDVPSGLHTDTGAVLGCAIRATQTLCLGLWKRACLQEAALPYLGTVERIDFDIPWADIEAVLGPSPQVMRITQQRAMSVLPMPRPLTTHKYREGHVLLICGSERYMGAAILTGLAARASGVGLISIAVPMSLKTAIATRIPDAITLACPETESGAIAQLPDNIQLGKYNAIACGPGLTLEAHPLVPQVLSCDVPLLLDADGLNILARMETDAVVSRRRLTVITPHGGEFKRLFPTLADELGGDRPTLVQKAAQASRAMVVLKGGRVAIAHPDGRVWLNPNSTPALARGGSGDVLTGLMGGLMAQAITRGIDIVNMIPTAVWWHAQAGRWATQHRTELGVDAETLAASLIPALAASDSHPD